MRPLRTMLKTELKLSLQGMDMAVFATIVPLVVLVILSVIYGNRPVPEGSGYSSLGQPFGAFSTITICAGDVMKLPLVVSDYRGKHVLKRYQMTPVNPALILLVQVATCTLYAVISLLSLCLTTTVFFGYRFRGPPTTFPSDYPLVVVSMFNIGTMVGGMTPNVKIAGIIASILYFPMLLLSGVTLPYEVMSEVLQKFADILPLTQGIELPKTASSGLPITNMTGPVLIMTVLAVLCAAVSLWFSKWETGF